MNKLLEREWGTGLLSLNLSFQILYLTRISLSLSLSSLTHYKVMALLQQKSVLEKLGTCDLLLKGQEVESRLNPGRHDLRDCK